MQGDHKPVIIGHRGAKGLAPENTLDGFKKAIEHGVDEIEFDVRVSKDGVPVLSHDPEIHNAAGQAFAIRAHTVSQLRRQKPDLCTLDQALLFIAAGRPIVIEVKPGQPLKQLIKLLKRYLDEGSYKDGDLRLASFDFKILSRLHRKFPGIEKVVNESWSGVRATRRAKRLGTKRITMRSWWLWSGFVASMSRAGWQLSAYTVNDPAKARRWAKRGLWGVVTDYPDYYQKKGD